MKTKRQAKIVELIGSRDVETQSELTRLLCEAGYDVTQATVSRDIRELKLTKSPTEGGASKYSLTSALDDMDMVRLRRMFTDGFVSMDSAGNILVIRTYNGMAMAVAAALDAMHFPEILGSIAGDDVVMCAIKTEQQMTALMDKLRK